MAIKDSLKISGFTLIELMVVTAIMVILAGIFVVNLNGQRAARNVKIAQNQLVSDIRKIQSYTLSARTLASGDSVQYYIMKFNMATPTQYTIQAITNVNVAPKLQDIETVNLPVNIRFAETNPVVISRALNPTTQNIFSNPACALVAFAAPYGKIIFNDGCTPVNSSTNPVNLNLSDDYYSKIINFQTNTACDAQNGNPPQPSVCSSSIDSSMTITLTDTAKTVSKTITINGVTGSVTFN